MHRQGEDMSELRYVSGTYACQLEHKSGLRHVSGTYACQVEDKSELRHDMTLEHMLIR